MNFVVLILILTNVFGFGIFQTGNGIVKGGNQENTNFVISEMILREKRGFKNQTSKEMKKTRPKKVAKAKNVKKKKFPPPSTKKKTVTRKTSEKKIVVKKTVKKVIPKSPKPVKKKKLPKPKPKKSILKTPPKPKKRAVVTKPVKKKIVPKPKPKKSVTKTVKKKTPPKPKPKPKKSILKTPPKPKKRAVVTKPVKKKIVPKPPKPKPKPKKIVPKKAKPAKKKNIVPKSRPKKKISSDAPRKERFVHVASKSRCKWEVCDTSEKYLGFYHRGGGFRSWIHHDCDVYSKYLVGYLTKRRKTRNSRTPVVGKCSVSVKVGIWKICETRDSKLAFFKGKDIRAFINDKGDFYNYYLKWYAKIREKKKRDPKKCECEIVQFKKWRICSSKSEYLTFYYTPTRGSKELFKMYVHKDGDIWSASTEGNGPGYFAKKGWWNKYRNAGRKKNCI